jgi:hypothetical protein
MAGLQREYLTWDTASWLDEHVADTGKTCGATGVPWVTGHGPPSPPTLPPPQSILFTREGGSPAHGTRTAACCFWFCGDSLLGGSFWCRLNTGRPASPQ